MIIIKHYIILFLLIGSISIAHAQTFPSKDWQPKPDPVASPYAEKGGQLSIFAGQSTKSFNYYLDNNVFTAEIFGAMYETLLSMNSTTLDYEPALAEKWIISPDKKTFTFYMHPNAKWSDGKPITTHDVKWTYDAIMAPENMTGVHKVSLERFDPPVIVNDREIRFTAKEIHWQNLGALGGFHILPKHAFEKLDFNKINFEFPVISGSYKIGDHKEGLYMTLEKRKSYWASNDVRYQGIGNFQTLKFVFFAERTNAFEAFKKGMIDLFPIYTSRIWMEETTGEKFDNNWIIKQKIYNQRPVGFQGFAMNMRHFPFDDIHTRQAMAFLLDRAKMNKTLMYDQYFLHRSYYEDLYDQGKNPNPLIPFNKEKARALLNKAGWTVNAKNGLLEKNNKPFVFSFLTRSSSTDKFLAIYAEDLKDVGIQMKIDQKDWAAWAKDMDSFNYQMTWASWSAGIFKDPEGMWASKEADRQGSNNITGFKNQDVDKLIDQQKAIFDVQKRHAICRTIDQIISSTFPYVLLWNINYTRLLYWNKFNTPETVLSKYGDERAAYWYWWHDPDSEADLSHAISNKKRMPSRPSAVNFHSYSKKKSKESDDTKKGD